MDIIVTGASKGIGRELVKILAGQGHQVVACARSGEKLRELQAEMGEAAQVIPLTVDLASPESYDVVAKTIKQHALKPAILINNAGYLVNKPFEDLCADDFEQAFNINVKAVFLLVQALLPFLPTGAHIVNIGSMGGYQGSAKFSGLALYSAAKGALAILTECLAEELKAKGIKVNCLALGAAQTEMLAEAFPGYKAPLSAAEMAGFIADFSLHGSKYFNGKILPVSVSTP
jgi:NAD(P)-dependent dehydrogenase (short-subunit alcohol dehydrogenase family)